ncbi:MAG: PASTA domain-containing protein [Bacteroidales bacterium]
MGLFSFITSKKFFLHLGLIFVTFFIVLWMVFRGVDSYTRHGEVYFVPDFVGQRFQDIAPKNENLFTFIITDSIFKKNQPQGTILMQDPLPGSKVKMGRNMYIITVAKMPDKVKMPNLRNLSLRQAEVILESNDLILNDLFYVAHFAKNAVVEQEFNGAVIEPGTEIFRGSSIDLSIGNGGNMEQTEVPFLIGMRPREIGALLHASNLNLGNEVYMDDNDTIHARVFRTEPASLPGLKVDPGTKISVWYRSNRLVDFEEVIQQAKNDTSVIVQDSLPNYF